MADIKNQADFDANIAAIEKNRQLNKQFYDSFKQTVENGNREVGKFTDQIKEIRANSTLSDTEKNQKILEIRKGPLAEILSITIADSKAIFLNQSELPSTPGSNAVTYLKFEADTLKGLETAVSKNNEAIAKLESNLGTPNKSSPENPPPKAQAENKVNDDNPKINETKPVETSKQGNSESQATNSSAVNSAGAQVEKAESIPENSTSSKPNKRQYNPLSKFSSVTYKISLYALTPDAYNNFFTQGKWITKDLELILQSGGVTAGVDSARNKFFNLDMYIDNLEIITKTNSKETAVAGNQSDLKFQIFEPYGMTFPSKLVAAQVDLQQRARISRQLNSEIEAMNTPFLLVVRFYGYDANGSLVTQPIDSGASNSFTKTDTTAAFERAFPVLITKLTFKLENKTTVYDVTCKLLNEQIAYGLKRGITKTGITVTADTVENALGGTDNSKNGLLDKFNAQQLALVTAKKQAVADEYKIVFQKDSNIGDALIVDKDFYVKTFAPTVSVTNANQVNLRTAQLKGQTVDKGKRAVKIAEGVPIMTAIDQIISQSTYLRDAMKAYDKEETEQTSESDTAVEANKNPKVLTWYSVRPQVDIKEWDDVRKDYAYKITYIIQQYKVPYVRSLLLKGKSTYYGPHKIYNYWYTGENSEVLSYEMQFNLLYYNTAALSSESATESRDTAPNSPVPGQGADPTGKLPGKFELQNNIKTFLYSPADQLKAQLKILGDPDFLMPVEAGSIQQALELWYGEDYSINANTGQVFIEIGFKEVEDYDNDSGLLKPKNNIKFWNYPSDIEQVSQGRMIYMVTQVTSKFGRGIFTQDLKTILPDFTASTDKTTTPPTAREPAAPVVTPTRPPVVTNNNPKPTPAVVNSNTAEGMKNYVPRRTPVSAGTSNSNDDYTDPMGTTDGAAIMNAARPADDVREKPKPVAGRGAPRTYDTTNKTRRLTPR
jgi:hypothetical protein